MEVQMTPPHEAQHRPQATAFFAQGVEEGENPPLIAQAEEANTPLQEQTVEQATIPNDEKEQDGEI